MKKLYYLILLSIFLFVGCQRRETNTKPEPANDITGVVLDSEDPIDQDDLVYRDYGFALELPENTTLSIARLDLNLRKENTAIIYVINLESKEIFKLSDYQPGHDITYTTSSGGIYQVIAMISTGEIIDLTPDVLAETSITGETSGGFLPLQ